MKKFKNSLTNKVHNQKNLRKYVAIASAAVIAFGTFSAVPVLATKNPTLYKISTFLGIEKDMESYENIIGKEVTKDGITMKINEVILNHDQLLVSVTTTSAQDMSETYVGPTGDIYLNGEEINTSMRWSSKLIDEHTGLAVLSFPLQQIPEETVSISLKLKTPLSGQERSPHWEYEFKADGEALKKDTQVVALDASYTLPEGGEVVFTEYVGNVIGHELRYTGSESFLTHDMQIKGVDEEGNEITFTSAGEEGGKGNFVVSDEDKQVADEAKTITCHVYVAGEQIGETFTIHKN